MANIISNEQQKEKAKRFFETSYMVQEPTVAYRHDYAKDTYSDAGEYPFMESYDDEGLANHVLSREEEYAQTGKSVDFQDMMVDFKNEFKW